MSDWDVTESEIQAIEKRLLPKECHFAEDAKAVIRCWQSRDITACPGSGKTTVLLAKLKLLADRMPLANGAGICVLSHTNAAVDEIKKRLSDCSDKLLSYPNYVGTIQSFIDRFITKPYVIRKYGRMLQPVDTQIYMEHLCNFIFSGKYQKLKYFIINKISDNQTRFKDPVAFISALSLDHNGSLFLQGQKSPIAGCGTDSARQFFAAAQELLATDGIIQYKDTYPLARSALAELKDEYTELFSERFQYVFIDEYQDCNTDQRDALNRLFNSSRCAVMNIGDPDQAIYSFGQDNTDDWVPRDTHLEIESSCRYTQEIANILVPLRVGKNSIVSSVGNSGYKPVIIVFDEKTISDVLDQFVVQLERKGLHDPNGTYKAIGYIGKKDVSGLNISSYWSEYDSNERRKSDYRYWAIIDDISIALLDGKLYRAELLTRKLICKLLHYARVTNPETSKEYTPSSLRERLIRDYKDIYTEHIMMLAKLQSKNNNAVDDVIRRLISALFAGSEKSGAEIIADSPDSFFEPGMSTETAEHEKNVYIEPIRGRKIQFGTIHSVKGQTHDATLYLETERNGGSDISRILCRYGIGRERGTVYNSSRKLAYVGFSRPRKLLCIAMQASTYGKSKTAFQNENWEIIDIRNLNG